MSFYNQVGLGKEILLRLGWGGSLQHRQDHTIGLNKECIGTSFLGAPSPRTGTRSLDLRFKLAKLCKHKRIRGRTLDQSSLW